MAYLQLPNGKYLKVPDGMSPNEAYDAALAKFPNLLDEPQKKKGLGAALGKGFESTIGSMQTGLEAIVSPEKAAKKGMEREEALSDKYADQTSLDQLKKVYEEKGLISAGGELLRQVPLAIAEQAPNLATMYAGAKLGARAPIPGVYGKAIGAGLGALAPSLLQQFGGNVERQAAEQKEAGQPINISRTKALAAAAPQAALDVAASFIPLGGKVAGKVFGPEVEKLLMRGGTEAAERLAQEGFVKTLGKGLGVGALAEIPTEIAQQMLERAQAGLALTSPDALKEYGETAYQVGLLAPLGGAGRFIDKSAARGDIKAKDDAEQARIAAEQQKADEEANLNKQAMDEMAKIAAENKPTFALNEQQLADMQREIGTQRFDYNKKLDDLRAEAQNETDIDRLVDIGNRATQVQAILDQISPAGIQKQIKEVEKTIKEKGAELKAAQKANDEQAAAVLTQELTGMQDSLAELKAKAPAYAEVAAGPAAKSVKDQIATKLKAIDKARDTGDLQTLAKLAQEVKSLQSQYGGEQTSLFETGKEGTTYPEAEQREAAQARELEATRPDMAPAKPKTKEEKLMDDTMAMLREDLPEPEKKAIQQIQLLPIGELRANLVKLETQRREVLKDNPELTTFEASRRKPTKYEEFAKQMGVGEETPAQAAEKSKFLKNDFYEFYSSERATVPQDRVQAKLTEAGKKLAAIEDSILATQQRIDEEEIGSKLPKGRIPPSIYELPAGYPTEKYKRFADQTKLNNEQTLSELTQTLFNLGKGIEDDIANTPELINKKIEGLRAVVIRNALREVAARRHAEGMEMLTTDAALKLSSRIDENLRELINRIPALPKNQVIDAMGMAIEPRIELRGKPSQIKFKKQQEELANIRGELVKVNARVDGILNTSRGKELKAELAAAKTADQVKAVENKIKTLPDMPFWAEKKRKLEVRQAFLEKEIGGAVTGTGLQPTVVQKLGKITIDPRDPSERPFANLKRALQIIEGDIDEAKSEAVASKGAVQKVTPDIKQERDPVAALNALLPKTAKADKIKSALYQAQNAAKPNPDAIKAIKNQLIDLASNKRSAALYLEEIEKTKAKEQETEAQAAKQEKVSAERAAPSGVKLATEKEKAEREQLPKEKRYPVDQQELFGEKELQPLATVRATPESFLRFINSAVVFKLKEKLGLLEKKDAVIAQRIAKAPSLAAIKAQRELIKNLENLDSVVANFRWNAAQLWQGRRKIVEALDTALYDLKHETTPKIDELKAILAKQEKGSAEHKATKTQIAGLKNVLYTQNIKKAATYATALKNFDESVEERDAAIEAIQARIQDLQVRNIKDERKLLGRMERQYANQVTEPAKKAKEYADKARAFEAQDTLTAEESVKQRIATKRIEQQNRKEALEQLPVIRRITEQTRAFVTATNSKALRAEIRELESKLEKAAPGSPQYAKLSVQIGGLKADLDRAIQPLMRKVVEAEITPEVSAKPISIKTPSEYDINLAKAREAEVKGDKEAAAKYRALAAKSSKESKETTFGKETKPRTTRKKTTEAMQFGDYTKAGTVQPARQLGTTTGYTYLTKSTEDIDKLLEEAQEAAMADLRAKGKAAKSFAPTVVEEEEAGRVKVAEVKAREGELRDQLEATKKQLVAHNREVAATEKALKGAKTPKKIAELKKRLAGLRQSATKQELGDKIDALTKEYREVRALGSGVERMLATAEQESLKSSRLNPLKTGVKRPVAKKESITGEATRREYTENEAAEAGVRRVDYLSVLDGLEGGFKARDENTQGDGVSQAAVEKELAKIKMPKGLDIIVIDKIPPQMAEKIDARGYDPKTIRGAVMANGKVLIFAGNHKDIKDVNATIAHELIGHVGVDGLLGEEGMRALAKKIQKTENSVFELAKKLGVLDDVLGAYAAARKRMPEEDSILAAVRELIAHVEEARPNRNMLQKANAFIKMLVGAVRAMLRKRGVDLDISTSDIYKLLRDARANFKDMAPGAHINKMGEIVFRAVPAEANDLFKGALRMTKGIVAEQKSLIDRIRGDASGMIFETKYVDQFAPMQAVAKKMEDSLKATQMMYYLRMHGQRMSFVSEVASNGPLDLVKASDGKGYVIESQRGASLAEMAKALGKAGVGNSTATARVFTLWMFAQRVKNSRVGINKLDTSGKITQAMLDEVERNVAMDPKTRAAFKEASDIYAKYNEGLINFAVKAGAISAKDAKVMLDNKNFIPFYRQRPNTKEVFLEIGGAPAIKIGNLTDQPYLHELIGGDQPIFDIFTSALQNTSMLTDMALRNMATKDVANSLSSLGMLRTDPESKKDTGIHEGEGKVGPNVIRFKNDGKMYWAEVDTKTTDIPSELLVKGLEGVNTSLPKIVETMNMPANLLRKWVTRNPAYALRQLIRDPLNAVFVSGLDTIPVGSSIKEIGKMWRGKSEGETLLQRRGILGGQVLTGTVEDQNKILNDILSGNKGWDYRMAQLDKLAIQGDAATRIVMYNNFMKQGLSEMEATLATLESMNFSKRGISPSLFTLSTMVPFMNAQIQGLNVLYKAATNQMPFAEKLQIKNKLIQRAVMMTAFTMIYASLMQDDEAYQNANDDEKYGNWFFPNPFGEDHIKVPIPFELGLLFKAIPEALVNTIFGDTKAKDAMSAIAKMAWNNVPNFTPQGIKPVVEVATNYSFYTGRAIESARMQQYEPGERYDDRTSEIAKGIGGMLNISPTKIEYLIKGYTGSLPLAVASLANPILRSGEAGEKPDSRSFIGSETPLFGSFFQPKDATGLINKAYGDMGDVIKAKETYDKMLEEGRDSDAQAYVDANADLIGMSSMAGKFRQQMGELTKQERAIRSATGISGKEKRDALDEVRQQKIELSKEFSSARE
jgi:hypothetical protein